MEEIMHPDKAEKKEEKKKELIHQFTKQRTPKHQRNY